MSVSKNKKNYAVFKADNFSEAGLKSFSRALEQNGCPVASITATNKALRKDGVITKKAVFYFENQQVVEVVVGTQGDIITLKINGKIQPTGLPKKTSEFANHIGKLLKSGQKKFDASLKKRLARIKTNTADKKPASRTNVKRIEEAQGELEEATKALSLTRIKANKINEEWSQKQNELLAIQEKVDDEKKRQTELRKTFKSLTK
ncbi:hypothetical protein [Aliivibrio salmonicida]|uniref:hypothetical protein n=1 Tax=Aliivibrio salmonicida TaxID=40269 RepID=UPI003D139FB8